MIKYEQNLCTLFCSSFGTMRLNINKMNVIFFESSMSAFLTKHINRQPPETIQYSRCSKKMARNLHDLLKTTQADHKPTYHGQQDTASLLCIFDKPEHPFPFEDIQPVRLLVSAKAYQLANSIFLSQQTSTSRTYQPRNQPANRLVARKWQGTLYSYVSQFSKFRNIIINSINKSRCKSLAGKKFSPHSLCLIIIPFFSHLANAEIWLILKYCERKILFHGWKVVLNTNRA